MLEQRAAGEPRRRVPSVARALFVGPATFPGKPREPRRRVPSVARAAASPSAIALAGAGVAAGELGHLGIAATVVLGAAGYGGRLAWAALHRRRALRRRAQERLERIDPWSLPEPWRGYVSRALDARKRLRELAGEVPAGVAATPLAEAVSKVDAAVEEYWLIARSGAAVAGPPGRAEKLAAELAEVQARQAVTSTMPGTSGPGTAGTSGPGTSGPGTSGPGTSGPGTSGPGTSGTSTLDPFSPLGTPSTFGSLGAPGSGRETLLAREESLASQLRSARRAEAAAARVAARLDELSAELEGLVAIAAELVASAGLAGPGPVGVAGPGGSVGVARPASEDLGVLSSRLAALSQGLEEARRIAAPGEPGE